MKRKLPVGVQTFRKMREDGSYYVDKTPFMERLLRDGTHFFLSRPRRFGKSLFLDTLKALFEGLAIHDNWDWSERHPVVRLDFSRGDFSTPGYLHTNVMAQLDSQEQAHGVAGRYNTAPERLGHLLETLHERDGKRTVLLVDDLDGLRELFHAFYASIPHQWYTNNDIANYEGFYASVFYSYFAGLGLDVTVEDSTGRGRLDMALRFEGRVYLFEFKVVEQAGEGSAMAQLEARSYADKYRTSGPVRLVGVEFSSESRNIVSFETGWG